MTTHEPGQAPSRRPGRPPQTDEEAQRARDNILEATTQVFAEFGYHGINVAKIIDAAGIARPTFYRYFKNTDEALTDVLHTCGRTVGMAVAAAVQQTEGHVAKVLAAIDSYLAWTMDTRHLQRSLYPGMHDPTSLVHRLRPLLLDRLVIIIGDQFEQFGRPRPPAATLDLLLNSMEYACHRLHLENPDGEYTEAAINLTRLNMTRVALALIGSADDWRSVVEHPKMLEMITQEG